ncbi:unnamed protein product [Leptosia nina]|uniref:Uncharacterized protein n=1 Tax=Leptosia nina TaxID=320188 RepID=A0AAV1JWU9_9NEOP
MFAKILLVSACVGIAVAQYGGYGHGNAHAVSSQNIVLHQNQGHVQHAPVYQHQPAVIQHQPLHYAAPVQHQDYHLVCFAAVVATAFAQYGHGHGHGYSSQHFHKHDGHPQKVHGAHGHHDYHVLLIAAVVAVASAQYGGYHGYGQASHSIVQHQPAVVAHQPVLLQHQPARYAAPVHQDYNVLFFASIVATVLGHYVPHYEAHSEQRVTKYEGHPEVVQVGGYHGHGHQIDYHVCLSSLILLVFLEYGQCHGPAYSSQHFHKHDGHPEVIHVKGHHGHGHIDYHIPCRCQIRDPPYSAT